MHLRITVNILLCSFALIYSVFIKYSHCNEYSIRCLYQQAHTIATKEIFRVVVASRLATNELVLDSSLLGISLNRFPISNLELVIYANNSKGLSTIYNKEIEFARNNSAILIFVHDDLFLLDYFWYRAVFTGLLYFDMIGVAGCAAIVPYQTTWKSNCEIESGSIFHLVAEESSDLNTSSIDIKVPDAVIFNQEISGEYNSYESGIHQKERKSQSYYGPTPYKVALLDGVLLAVRSETLILNNITFDELFDFHFYDMDIARQFAQKNLTLGTWPIATMHRSRGNIDFHWNATWMKYIQKWGD